MPTLVPLKFRGGATLLPAAAALLSATPAHAAKASELVNCVGGAQGFFGNVRVPAALLAGAALGQLWASPDNKQRATWLQPAFSVAVALTVLCELLVVLISTAASTHLLTGAFDPMATSTMAFLLREMELHWVACRFNFFGGLICFVGALALRVWAAFPGHLGSGLALIFAATGLHFIAFFNKTIVNYSYGILGLGWRYVTLLVPKLASSPVGAISLLIYVAGAGYLYKALSPDDKDKAA